jgi:hypothetical protein
MGALHHQIQLHQLGPDALGQQLGAFSQQLGGQQQFIGLQNLVWGSNCIIRKQLVLQ